MIGIEKKIVAAIARKEHQPVARLGLRFDRSAGRLADDLHAFADSTVPVGMTILIAVTAPIRVRAKTAVALKSRVESFVALKPTRRDRIATIFGNYLRIRVLKQLSKPAPKLLLFVHNPKPGAMTLLNLVEGCLEL